MNKRRSVNQNNLIKVTPFEDIDMNVKTIEDFPKTHGSKVQLDSYESDNSDKKSRSKYIDDLDSQNDLQNQHQEGILYQIIQNSERS